MDSLWINSAILYTVKLVPAQHFSLLPKYPSFPIPIKHLGIAFVPTYALLSLLPTIHIQVSPFPSTVIVLHFSFSVFQSLAFLFFPHLALVPEWLWHRTAGLIYSAQIHSWNPLVFHGFFRHPHSTAVTRSVGLLVCPAHALCGFSCISAEACWGNTPCAPAGQ